MMKPRSLFARALLALFAAGMAGCHDADLSPPASNSAGIRVRTPDPSSNSEQAAESAPQAASQAKKFEPPSPDRQELFAPPDPTRMVNSQERGPGSLTLRGFADFEGRRVLLEIDGKVIVLRAGQQSRGIEVISIDPPRVTLQCGGQRWTAQLMPL